MVKLNRNLEKLPTYWGARLEEITARLKKEGKDVIPLGIGDPDIPIPQPIIDAIIGEFERYHGYPTSKGRVDLRETLAQYYGQRFNVDVLSDNFTIAMGAKNDLFDVSRVFSNPGDAVLILEPAYPPYVNGATIDGCTIRYLPCTKETGFEPDCSLGKEELEKVAILYLCNPNNPTGTTLKRSSLMRFVELANEYGFLILHDIAYCDFVPGGKPFVPNPRAPSIFEFPDADKVALEVGSFSKPFSMTGIRLSWAVSRGEINEIWTRYRTNRDSGVSEYIQRGGIAAFDPYTFEIVEANMKVYGERAKTLESGFKEMGLECNPITNTPYAWVRCPDGWSSESFVQNILTEVQVILTAGNSFGPSGEGYFRATIFQPKHRLEKAIERMKKSKVMT